MTVRPLSLTVLIAVLTSLALTSKAQTSDPQAVTILQQALIAAGGTRGLATIHLPPGLGLRFHHIFDHCPIG